MFKIPSFFLTVGAPVALGFTLLGCSPSALSTKSSDFFVSWLQSHGETNIVQNRNGVGVAGSPTRLRLSLYGSETNRNGTTAELEFRIRLPDGKEIIEFVAGNGNSLQEAESDAKANFVLTTFHVVYGGFMNPADPHHSEEKVTIDGKPRVIVMGDTYTRSGSTNTIPDLSGMRSRFRELVSTLTPSPGPHWIKIVYAQNHARVMTCAVTLDNKENAALTAAVEMLPWPSQEDFYMAKQFIVVK